MMSSCGQSGLQSNLEVYLALCCFQLLLGGASSRFDPHGLDLHIPRAPQQEEMPFKKSKAGPLQGPDYLPFTSLSLSLSRMAAYVNL